jgi:dihydrofolate reductase
MIKSIFAVDPWGGMGYKGSLPWPHCKEDLQHFKNLTDGQIVIMGRKTYDDPKMPKPLPNRTTYVITHRPLMGVFTIQGDIKSRIDEIARTNPRKTVWVIGGPDILMTLKDITKEAYVTHFRGQYRTDVQIDLRKYLNVFQARSAKSHPEYTCNWMMYKNIDIFNS